MRIIAGTFRSRRSRLRRGWPRGPPATGCARRCSTCWRRGLRARLFSDLYAGSGAVGIEALSRGAARVKFVERAPAALKALRDESANGLGMTAGFRVHAGSVAAYLRSAEVGGAHELRRGVSRSALRCRGGVCGHAGTCWVERRQGLLAEGAVVIAEHRRKERLGRERMANWSARGCWSRATRR